MNLGNAIYLGIYFKPDTHLFLAVLAALYLPVGQEGQTRWMGGTKQVDRMDRQDGRTGSKAGMNGRGRRTGWTDGMEGWDGWKG